MPNTAVNHPHLFTYGHYSKWPEEERWELIDGVAYNMTPAQSTLHQRISREMSTQIDSALTGRPCELFAAPFDVRLPDGNEADDEVLTVVQPDLLVVCDASKIDNRGCRGAPDFIIEIISPSTGNRDQIIKTALYEKHGVREYWIIHPQDKLLIMRTLGNNDRYQPPRIIALTGTATVDTLPGLEIDLDEIAKLCAQDTDQENGGESGVREQRI